MPKFALLSRGLWGRPAAGAFFLAWFCLLPGVCLLAPAARAQDGGISGVWRSAVEGTPGGMGPEVNASDVQMLWLNPNGEYRREIVVEGGDGGQGVGGKIIDTGVWRFTPPSTLEYQRRGWFVCTFAGCNPAEPPGANAGALPFQITGPGQAWFIGLSWVKLQ